MLELSITCRRCGKVKVIKVQKKGYEAWLSGRVAIQHAMPEVSADDREMLMSQICGECFDEMFAES